VVRNMCRLLIRLYDVAIVVPLLIERVVKGRMANPRPPRARRMADMDADIERTHA
jgi:hypothetical protein